jgi:hypothetical protein
MSKYLREGSVRTSREPYTKDEVRAAYPALFGIVTAGTQPALESEPDGPIVPGVIVDAVPQKRIRWGLLCWGWFFAVLFWIIVSSRTVPPEQVPEMVRETQRLMGMATVPLLLRGAYRLIRSDW